MRKVVSLLIAALLAAIVAQAAQAHPRQQQQINTLKSQVTLLKSHVSALSSETASLNGEITSLRTDQGKLNAAIAFVNDKDTCGTALTFDVLRAMILGLTGSDPGRVDDGGACSRIGVTRGAVAQLRATGGASVGAALIAAASAIQAAALSRW